MNIPEGYIGLCAYCIFNMNSAMTPVIGRDNRGLAKDMEGEIVTLPNDRKLLWKPGEYIPAGGNYLSGIILTLGRGADLRGYQSVLDPFAVTMRDGTLLCEQHNGELLAMGNKRR